MHLKHVLKPFAGEVFKFKVAYGWMNGELRVLILIDISAEMKHWTPWKRFSGLPALTLPVAQTYKKGSDMFKQISDRGNVLTSLFVHGHNWCMEHGAIFCVGPWVSQQGVLKQMQALGRSDCVMSSFPGVSVCGSGVSFYDGWRGRLTVTWHLDPVNADENTAPSETED